MIPHCNDVHSTFVFKDETGVINTIKQTNKQTNKQA
jgi:hypothetical protein